MPQTRESALQNTVGSSSAAALDGREAMPTPDHRNRTVHLVSRVAPGLSDAALAELISVAERLRREEGLVPVELTAQW
ncbi:hypothetical protein [Nocardia sp. NPDC051832]|uniref:hypothetical protein n=1 Tax=Nocardia sp. NPDC051832 TaxID=3155673 RepID=UPI0034414C61